VFFRFFRVTPKEFLKVKLPGKNIDSIVSSKKKGAINYLAAKTRISRFGNGEVF
jgi:hypothetical protein